MTPWTIQDSEQLYKLNRWGAGYFGINEAGHIVATPLGPGGPSVDIKNIVDDITRRGSRPPLLLRFSDIIRSRIEKICECFNTAIRDANYRGKYMGVYPIKVNQQSRLVSDIVRYGQPNNLGLEAGSKPELLICLAALKEPGSLIICNGYKDGTYIETALIAGKLGHVPIIVIDRPHELDIVIEKSRALNIRPRIGFRAKLESRGFGKWVESSGAKSKFGLTPLEMIRGIEKLKAAEMIDCLNLLHFHMGSQIPDIATVKAGLREGGRVLSELARMGGKIQYLDVGGGLGVDYDGSNSTSISSVNYTDQEYANDIVFAIADVCQEAGIEHPNIITEAGRAMTAHHSVLIFNVFGVNRMGEPDSDAGAPVKTSHKLVRTLQDILASISPKNYREPYNDAQEMKSLAMGLFNLGQLTLEERADVELLYWQCMRKIRDTFSNMKRMPKVAQQLQTELADMYFCNFSLFKSAPDSWAINQVFPIMPIHRLNEQPTALGTLVDLTCDSDGKINKFIDSGGPKPTLELHPYKHGEEYLLGMFLVGAYQEILGDMHNLFGETDVVVISVGDRGYELEHVVDGDAVEDVLRELQYERRDLIGQVRTAIDRALRNRTLSPDESRTLLKHFEDNLNGYTYLDA